MDLSMTYDTLNHNLLRANLKSYGLNLIDTNVVKLGTRSVNGKEL